MFSARRERGEVVRVGSGPFEVGDGEAECVQHHCREVTLPVIAREGAEGGGNALQAQIGTRFCGARLA